MKPKIYTASKVFRATMWQDFAHEHKEHIDVISSWIVINVGPLKDADASMCKQAWIQNIQDVNSCDYLMCFAEHDDELSGTLVEIGAALAGGKRIILCGDCARFSTWKHHPFIIAQVRSVEIGLLRILADWKHYEVKNGGPY